MVKVSEKQNVFMKPVPIDEAVKLDKHKYIMSRTDHKGIIEFGNDYFFEISGYTAKELMGKSHSVIRHPDMPRVIFKIMWERLQRGQGLYAVVKNMAKDGRYYWVTTHFDIKKHPVSNEVVGYMAYRQATKPDAVKQMEALYKHLLEIEETGGLEASEKYLIGYLESRQMTYDTFVDEVIGNKGAFKLFFSAMRKLFK